MRNYRIRLPSTLRVLLCLGIASAASAQSTPTAEYEVVFNSTWSEETHPQSFPGNPHFSGLIGGTHNAQVVFWSVGAPATTGIEVMAEQGGTTPLSQEVQIAISQGTADTVVSGSGIGTSPGTATASFTADRDFPMLTLVSMLAPSPDWFVGVAGLDLVQGGEWVNQVTVPLHVYDAGTDSGTSYTSGNADTNPADPITQFNTGLFAPPMDIVGSFTITRTDAPQPVPSLSAPSLMILLLGSIGAVAYYLTSRKPALEVQ